MWRAASRGGACRSARPVARRCYAEGRRAPAPPPAPSEGDQRWGELRRVLSAGPSTHGEDFGRRIRKLVRPGEEAAAVWAVPKREAQAVVLAAMAPTSGQLGQILGTVYCAHPSGDALTAAQALAPLVRHVGAAYSLDELRKALAQLPAQVAARGGQGGWSESEAWGVLLGESVPDALRDDYEGVAKALIALLKSTWARAAPAPAAPPRSLYSLRHAVRLGTSALAAFDQDWVNEEMFDAARELQNEVAQHFHKTHPGEPFGVTEYSALLTDLVTLLTQKLNRDTWTNMGFVNALVQHLSSEQLRGDDFMRFVHDVKLNLRGTLGQRLAAYATDLLAPVTGRPYQRPLVQLRSIC